MKSRENPFELSDDNKRYQTYNYYLRKRFGKKVFKISLNVDLGCPNRDGTKGTGGCIFCSSKLSGDFAGNPCDDIKTQFNDVKEKMHKKWSDGLYIPYFQAGSNTYASVETLRDMYYTALSFENVAGLSIATRADCITEEIADLLGEISKKTYLTVELGLQSIYDETAKLCNRCHTYAEFLCGFDMIKKRGINVCVHIINGLPFETKEMMIKTAETLGKLGIHSIKIHLLHILKGTRLAQMYENGEFQAMTLEDYVDTVCRQLTVLPEEVIIQRVTGDGAKNDLIAPLWSLKKFCVMNEIDKKMARENLWQGMCIDKKIHP